MSVSMTPDAGRRILMFQGDLMNFTLNTDSGIQGQGFLRTNLGHGAARADEIIARVESSQPVLNRDWHDIPMTATETSGEWSIALPLQEPGCFQAKAFFLPESSNEPEWPEGDNIGIKVEPAHTIAGNSVYAAFVRQFSTVASDAAELLPEESLQPLDDAGYTVIPPAGKFRDLIPHLDHILQHMGFQNLMLLPIHPVPTTFARMGRFGSPYASMDFMDVNPAFACFDRKSTPLEQFGELIDEVHHRQARIFIDLPINHTGWASHLQNEHPEWFKRHPEGGFMSPGAWGVTWEDLSELDYAHRDLWTYMADVFLFWCERGVDGFRCDAGYMVPAEVWEYIVAKVRRHYPETVFFLEGLGGHIHVMEGLIGDTGLNWAYSELFQNYDRDSIHHCVSHARDLSATHGQIIHFAETHDNNRLAATSPTYASMRIALCAALSNAGGFGITNGAEWFAESKLDVHENRSLSWGQEPNAIEFIASIQGLLNTHPAFAAGATLDLFDTGEHDVIGVHRAAPDGTQPITILINLDTHNERRVTLDRPVCRDLLRQDTPESTVHLEPGAVRFLATSDEPTSEDLLARPTLQQLKTAVLEIRQWLNCPQNENALEADARELYADAHKWISELAGNRPVLAHLTLPRDQHRAILAARGQAVQADAPAPFIVERRGHGQRRIRSFAQASGRHTAILFRDEFQEDGIEELAITLFADDEIMKMPAQIYQAGWPSARPPAHLIPGEALLPLDMGLLTNGRGGMVHARGRWGEIQSQYDTFLAANPDPECPVDRRMLWARCRAWLVYRGYSCELTPDCQTSFRVSNEDLTWNFDLPCGTGRRVSISVSLHMVPDHNMSVLTIDRHPASDACDLEDEHAIKLILRPDLEDRSFHEKTKAYEGAEEHWPRSVHAQEDSFVFNPGDVALNLSLPGGTFVPESEWSYNVPHPVDAQRGLGGGSDLFSPGYFESQIKGDCSIRLTALATSDAALASAQIEHSADLTSNDPPADMFDALSTAASAFIVRRNTSQTVIAGYPWFLDWGRDTFIALRGYIALGHMDETERILLEFARYEENGTIPNMIRGHDASNRDTSDAPLWFIAVCRAWIDASGDRSLLEKDCDGRTLAEIITSIIDGYASGTPNGIRMDESSRLIFSPTHYTWMDTAHPAGTPRQGYPIEIQALWHHALVFASEAIEGNAYGEWAAQARDSVQTLYSSEGIGLADCLHGAPGTPAAECTADDALRPNQLLAITLGLIEDKTQQQAILEACEELLVPGSIRSLADRPLRVPLTIEDKGRILADPHAPYRGYYEGDEDSSRKPAYHNGTAWTWMFPLYPEAFFEVHGDAGRDIALSLLDSSRGLLDAVCRLQLPEICDGHYPHETRGCEAQAWGVTEWCRVFTILNKGNLDGSKIENRTSSHTSEHHG